MSKPAENMHRNQARSSNKRASLDRREWNSGGLVQFVSSASEWQRLAKRSPLLIGGDLRMYRRTYLGSLIPRCSLGVPILAFGLALTACGTSANNQPAAVGSQSTSTTVVATTTTPTALSASAALLELTAKFATALPGGCWTKQDHGTLDGSYSAYRFYTNSVRVTDSLGNNTPDPTGTGCSGDYAGSTSDDILVQLYISPGLARQALTTDLSFGTLNKYQLAEYDDGPLTLTVPLSASPTTDAKIAAVPGLVKVWMNPKA